MSTNKKQFKEVLQKSGLKPTYQRLRILEHLRRHEAHPTVEMIYNDLVREIPTISKTTIYNTLNAFLDKGIIHAITITGTETRYDYRGSPHHHFLCRECGKIIDIDVQCPYLEKKEVAGHRIEELHGYFKGICLECLKRQQKK
ncbi:MAG: Fur family transcriptional regulator [Candidatus Zixiibacteriota bacterium]